MKQARTLIRELRELVVNYAQYDDEDLSFNPIQEALDEYGEDTTFFNAEKCKSHISENSQALFALVFDANGLYDFFSYDGAYSRIMLKKIHEWANANGLHCEPHNSWNLCFYRS